MDAMFTIELHVGQHMFGAQPRAFEVDGKHTVPLRLSHGDCVEVRVDACVVHQNVDAAMRLDDSRHRRLHLDFLRDVGSDERGESERRKIRRRFAKVQVHDRGTFCGEFVDDRATDSTGASGDNGDFVR
jgi:hypothetical protein